MSPPVRKQTMYTKFLETAETGDPDGELDECSGSCASVYCICFIYIML